MWDMASGWRFLLYLLAASQFIEAIDGRRMKDDNPSKISLHGDHISDSSINIFFTIDKLRLGTRLPLYFNPKDPSVLPPLLSRSEADSIPFWEHSLSHLLTRFSIPKSSPQARAMAYTLRECHRKPLKEVKFCATSLESMLDSAVEIMGSRNIGHTKVLTTQFVKNLGKNFQNYTILKEPEEVPAKRMIGCHTMPYPYAVYYCHGHDGGNRVFEISLSREDGGGEAVKAVAVCHGDTSTWNPDHVAFKLLGLEPGSDPVCHVTPDGDLVWVMN